MDTADLYLGEAGDDDEAERVAALKKPSRVAWELNSPRLG